MFVGIEEGKLYYNYAGQRVGPMTRVDAPANGGYRWKDGRGRLYTQCGRVFIDAIKSRWDIERECLDTSGLPPPLPPKALPAPQPPTSTSPPRIATSPVVMKGACASIESALLGVGRASKLISQGDGDSAVRELLAAIESLSRAAQLSRYL